MNEKNIKSIITNEELNELNKIFISNDKDEFELTFLNEKFDYLINNFLKNYNKLLIKIDLLEIFDNLEEIYNIENYNNDIYKYKDIYYKNVENLNENIKIDILNYLNNNFILNVNKKIKNIKYIEFYLEFYINENEFYQFSIYIPYFGEKIEVFLKSNLITLKDFLNLKEEQLIDLEENFNNNLFNIELNEKKLKGKLIDIDIIELENINEFE